MNYYIQGSIERCKEIEMAFAELGYDTTKHFFNAVSNLYFTFEDKIRATTDELFKTLFMNCIDKAADVLNKKGGCQ